MGYEFNGTDQRAEITTLPYTASATPVSVSLWFRPDALDRAQTVSGVFSTSNGRLALEIVADTTAGTARIRMVTLNQNSAGQSATAPLDLTAGDWYHVVGVAAVVTTSTFGTRRIYLNGTAATAENTANQAHTVTLSQVRIASRKTGTAATSIGAYFDGAVAELGIYPVTLETSDIVALSKGAKPTSVRPNDLAMYLPLVRSFDDTMDSRSLSSFNSPSVVPQVRRYG